MQRYANLSGQSGVASFEIGLDRITVCFNDGSSYVYTNASAGGANIAEMQRLALAGRGLNGFINTTVRKLYANKGSC